MEKGEHVQRKEGEKRNDDSHALARGVEFQKREAKARGEGKRRSGYFPNLIFRTRLTRGCLVIDALYSSRIVYSTREEQSMCSQ